MTICQRCKAYTSEKTCPFCGTECSRTTEQKIPEKINIRALASLQRSENAFLGEYNPDTDHELTREQTVLRKLAVIILDSTAGIQFRNLFWIHSNYANTIHWFQYQRQDNQVDVQIKFKLMMQFYRIENHEIRFGSPIHEFGFKLADAYIIINTNNENQSTIINYLHENELFDRPVIILSQLPLNNHETYYNILMYTWQHTQEALENLAKLIIRSERGVEVNFSIQLPLHSRSQPLNIPTWDGRPTIRILEPEIVQDREHNERKTNQNIRNDKKDIINFLDIQKDIAEKCLGHGEKITEQEVKGYCNICKGPICNLCFEAFSENMLCPGALWSFPHPLPSPKNV